jgi:hypothetical protein
VSIVQFDQIGTRVKPELEGHQCILRRDGAVTAMANH